MFQFISFFQKALGNNDVFFLYNTIVFGQAGAVFFDEFYTSASGSLSVTSSPFDRKLYI